MLDSYISGFWDGLGYLFIAGVIFTAYIVAKDGIGKADYDYEYNPKTKLYEVQKSFYWRILAGVFTVVVISGVIAFALLGSPSCTDSDIYPSSVQCDGSEEYIEYSNEYRIERFAYLLVILGIPALIGYYSRYKEITDQKALEEKEDIKQYLDLKKLKADRKEDEEYNAKQ